MRQKVAAAGKTGFPALHALRRDLATAGLAPGPEGLEVLELAFEAYLPWCAIPEAREQAASLTAAFACRVAERVLVEGGDLQRAVAVLERAWPFREQAGYHAYDLALRFADACRLAGRYADAERALDHCADIEAGTNWQAWSADEQLMLPIHGAQAECRRAALELSLGNPDGALPCLRRAARILDAQRRILEDQEAPVPAEHRQQLEQAWRAAAELLQREEVDCYLGMEHFAAAVRAAGQTAPPRGTLMHFYLTMARSWDPATGGERMAAVQADLEHYADPKTPNTAQRHQAAARLVELRAQAGDLAAAGDLLEQLAEDGGGGGEPRTTTLQTELLLLQDAADAVPRERLVRQKAAQLQACDQLLHDWSIVPVRDAGIGFLHYLFRRETIGQLVAITLRAAADRDRPPPEAAIGEALQQVMRAQVHGALARRLGATVPDVGALQRALRPHQGIVLFLPTAARTHVFAVTADRLSHHALPQGAVAIRGAIQDFVGQLQQATGELAPGPEAAAALAAGLRRTGRELTDMLIPAALRAQLQDWRSLTVIGSELLHGPVSGASEAGFLNYLPIECLPWDAATLFGQRFAIDHNVSLPVWARLADGAATYGEASALRVFGVLQPPADGSGAAAAPTGVLAGEHMDALCKPFRQRTLYLDANCLLANLDDRTRPASTGARQRSSIALFLAHGGYDASSERGSFLQFYGGRLDCSAAQRLGDPAAPFARLVVLAACRAAKAPNRAGDSLANLGGAFQLAGADAVVQSRFDLPLHRTQDLLGVLLQQLAKGSTVAEAMRGARAAPATADPLDGFRTGVLQVHGFGQTPR